MTAISCTTFLNGIAGTAGQASRSHQLKHAGKGLSMQLGYTCAFHAGLVQNLVQQETFALVILLAKDEGCDLNQKAVELSLHQAKVSYLSRG